ncbi:MAG TPA: aminotransferase class I/II-fold pyridoxal phosphate-dependent enzyme [Acidimicrobiales bacterium]|nr:aminotransferase class I/II-fold pyridoxal phosphate-dependent enzyme [Acidimicrobiales bacterium]
MSEAPSGFIPPTYPYDRLAPIEAICEALPGGMVDLSVGTPGDPPPPQVVEALGTSGAERGYPPSLGSPRLLEAARAYVGRRFDVELERRHVAICIGTKEFVAGIPQWLKLRDPSRDTVLYPGIAYPTYEMGALLAGCRAVAVAARADGSLDLDSVSEADAARALCLWLNSPSNPTGALDDLGAAAAWGRARGVPVLSDECYAEYTWEGRPRTILEHGTEGLLAVHSISKRSNCAGLRVGFYAGDPELVHYLVEVRRHAGFMVPGPIQLAGALALEDDAHVAEQRARYLTRLERVVEMLSGVGVKASIAGGSFYLWVPAPDDERSSEREEGEGPEWGFTRWLARTAGMLVSPGDFYGPAGRGYVRIAVVQPDERIELAAERLAAAG